MNQRYHHQGDQMRRVNALLDHLFEQGLVGYRLDGDKAAQTFSDVDYEATRNAILPMMSKLYEVPEICDLISPSSEDAEIIDELREAFAGDVSSSPLSLWHPNYPNKPFLRVGAYVRADERPLPSRILKFSLLDQNEYITALGFAVIEGHGYVQQGLTDFDSSAIHLDS